MPHGRNSWSMYGKMLVMLLLAEWQRRQYSPSSTTISKHTPIFCIRVHFAWMKPCMLPAIESISIDFLCRWYRLERTASISILRMDRNDIHFCSCKCMAIYLIIGFGCINFVVVYSKELVRLTHLQTGKRVSIFYTREIPELIVRQTSIIWVPSTVSLLDKTQESHEYKFNNYSNLPTN